MLRLLSALAILAIIFSLLSTPPVTSIIGMFMPALANLLLLWYRSFTLPVFTWIVGLIPSSAGETSAVIEGAGQVGSAVTTVGETLFTQVYFWVGLFGLILLIGLFVSLRRHGVGGTIDNVAGTVVSNPLPLAVLVVAGLVAAYLWRNSGEALVGMIPIMLIIGVALAIAATRKSWEQVAVALFMVVLVIFGIAAFMGIFVPPATAATLPDEIPYAGTVVNWSSQLLYDQVTQQARVLLALGVVVVALGWAYTTRQNGNG